MNKLIAIAALATLATSAHAQLSSIPPSSTTDGVVINAAQPTWAASPLGNYAFASDADLDLPNMHSPDNVLNLSWSHTTNSDVTSALANINTNKGLVRAIFVGESAGWLNNFGYTYTGHANSNPGSFTLFNNIQAAGSTPNISFGEYADITLTAGQASTFDFWLDAVGNPGGNPSQYGGVYTAINQFNSAPFIMPGNAFWATSPLAVNTWVQALNDGAGGYESVNTYLVGFEDWKLNNGSDRDYNDFMFAVQLFNDSGIPFGNPVPEPATYGLIGGIALLGLVARRRFLGKK